LLPRDLLLGDRGERQPERRGAQLVALPDRGVEVILQLRLERGHGPIVAGTCARTPADLRSPGSRRVRPAVRGLTRWTHARAIRNPPGNHGGRGRRAAVRGGLRGPLLPTAAGDRPGTALRDEAAARAAGLRHPHGRGPAQEAALAALPGGPAPRLRD